MVAVASLLLTRFELWGGVIEGIMQLGAFGLALWGLVVVVALSAVSYVIFRKAIP